MIGSELCGTDDESTTSGIDYIIGDDRQPVDPQDALDLNEEPV